MYDFVPELREFLIANGALKEFCDALVGDGRTDREEPTHPEWLIDSLMCWVETHIEDTLVDLHDVWSYKIRDKYPQQTINNNKLAADLMIPHKTLGLFKALRGFRAD